MNGQSLQFLNPNPQGYEYFNKGSELIKLGDYNGADSLLTLALRSYKNENVYFNRAVSRLLKTDTIGYCQDMDVAANKYFDSQAQSSYNNICCINVDTFYYDKKYLKSNKSNYRYYEIIKHPRYGSIIIGSFHDIMLDQYPGNFNYGAYNNLSFNFSHIRDIIAAYEIHDSVKYYFKTTQSISTNNSRDLKVIKKRTVKYLSNKYSYLKEENDKDKLQVFFKIFFNESGYVVDFKYVGFFPIIQSLEDVSELKKDLLDIVNNYPKVKPAQFYNEKVSFVFYDSIVF